MRSTYRTGMMVAAVALLASGSSALAADPTIESLQQQINALSQQLNALKTAPAAAPAAAPVQGAATVPNNAGPGFLQYGSSAGGFVIPGTKTALKIGGNMKFDMAWDFDAGIGAAGLDQYAIRSATMGTGQAGFALPGTAAARQTGRFSANAGYSRLNFETRTPSEYGEIKFYTEIDFAGGVSATGATNVGGGNAYNSNSHLVRLRHVYGTIGNWTIGQTWTLWSDRATLPNSVENNGPIGPESGVRAPKIAYKWNIDPAQKNQLEFAIENPFSDFNGADQEAFNGANNPSPTTFNNKYPDFLVRYGHNEDWGRTYLTGMVRDISINTAGIALSSGVYNGAANDSTIGWGVTGGGKIYTPFTGNAKNAVYGRVEAGQGIGRYMNFNSGSQNVSAVLDSSGHLKTVYAGSYELSYQHFWDSKNVWQSNVIWGDQKIWQKGSMLPTSALQGLPTDFQEVEFNLMWSPNSYVMMGPAYIRANARVVKPYTNMNTATGGATRTTSGTTAVDNRIQFTTQIGF
ncbi:DcaP family trimeric outer membrane transporter [Telmatospirillum sp.]|uniref:DcaP family trimeric outer membrane transporter n=1 Tax=Telmatospirillum sp. TaxID=2079197 RepID=UPI002851817C|nr:DcaP family trimeric outer membrane transporter [Telmatospirillum sp.]MDR3438673.1 DcaP family trimeric outer membrane transporter [Telmatospirillum sp.]